MIEEICGEFKVAKELPGEIFVVRVFFDELGVTQQGQLHVGVEILQDHPIKDTLGPRQQAF